MGRREEISKITKSSAITSRGFFLWYDKNMRIEIDQSGKIENTSKHTFLAFSNTQHLILKISSVEKRKLQKYKDFVNRERDKLEFKGNKNGRRRV